MSEGINRVTLLGNVGADPELRVTGGGQAVLNVRLATNEVFFDSAQKKQERTEWHTVILWGKRAEALSKLVHKGDRLLVEGRIQTKDYEGRDGQKKARTEIVATNVVLLGGRNGPARSTPPERHPADDDIPF